MTLISYMAHSMYAKLKKMPLKNAPWHPNGIITIRDSKDTKILMQTIRAALRLSYNFIFQLNVHVCAFQICSACMCEKLRIEHSPNDEATKKSERMRIEKENEGIKEDFDISAPLIGCIYFARCRLIYFSKPEISCNCKRKESRTTTYIRCACERQNTKSRQRITA